MEKWKTKLECKGCLNEWVEEMPSNWRVSFLDWVVRKVGPGELGELVVCPKCKGTRLAHVISGGDYA